MKNIKAISYAILAAVLFGINAPFSKLLLVQISPTFMASLLYLGAGFGTFIVNILKKKNKVNQEEHLKKDHLPYIVLMIILDIIAPILLMIGLKSTTSENASLLNNFEIVATSLIALIIFKEIISKKLWIAILLITISSLILSFENIESLSFSVGSIFIILACISWGFENNCTRKLSTQNPFEIVIIKGLGSGIGSFIIAFVTDLYYTNYTYIVLAILLGFVSYGLSIYFYVLAQRYLGASKTSSFYAFAPFIGAGLSFIIFNNKISINYIIALIIMIIGAYFAANDYHKHRHIHEVITHDHPHTHDDGHHNHKHKEIIKGEHSHTHTHEKLIHNHIHNDDLHHAHMHL